MDQDYEMFKIVVIGSMGTGKTNISTRFIRNEYVQGQKSTVGVQFLSKTLQIRNQNIKVTLWDTAGQQRYKSLSKVYYKGASGILIVYDVTQPQTYLDVQSWMRLANENLNLNQVVMMVVGNKIDLEDKRKVPAQRAIAEYRDKFDIDCWEVSAKTGFHVKEVFMELLEKIYQMNMKLKGSQMPIDIDDESYFGGSIVDAGSVLVRDTYKPPPKKNDKQIAPLPSIQEEVKKIEIKSEQPKKQIQKKVIPKQRPNQSVRLTVGDDKKKTQKKKKQKSGCC